ncbi:hypothetical protein [Companilactobacillus furfuricola]|uniref:hypothetical protein n=1 Tax=Companilactobacillus furfuricola TaxID=1462575 RepID=UPI000F76C75B|nr:hypothetical protein [Companilactobacillus furfuricola]
MFQIVYNQSALAKIATGGRYDAFASDRFDPSDILVGWAIETEFMKHLKPLLVDPQIVGVYLGSEQKMQVASNPDSNFSWNVEIFDPDNDQEMAHYQIKNGAVATSAYNDVKMAPDSDFEAPRSITLISKGSTEAAILAETAIKMKLTDAVDMIETSQLTGLVLPVGSQPAVFSKGRFNGRKLYPLKNNRTKLSQLLPNRVIMNLVRKFLTFFEPSFT